MDFISTLLIAIALVIVVVRKAVKNVVYAKIAAIVVVMMVFINVLFVGKL